MSTVGEQLREAREAQGLTVQQVAEVTKIRTDHIRALDEGDYDVFSAPVYIRGFVRSYAMLLKLDLPQIMEALQEELSQSGKHNQPPSFSKPSRGVVDMLMYQLSKVNWRIALPVLGVVLILAGGIWAYRAWSQQKTKDPLAGLTPGIYQPAKKTSGETLPLPTHR